MGFWLDCELYKDAAEENGDEQNLVARNRLFRDIQDKYRMTLTEEAQRQLRFAATNSGLSHTLFIRTQYDVLRRLRAYWLPRYIIHRERMLQLGYGDTLTIFILMLFLKLYNVIFLTESCQNCTTLTISCLQCQKGHALAPFGLIAPSPEFFLRSHWLTRCPSTQTKHLT